MLKFKRIPDSVALFIIVTPFLAAAIGSLGGAIRGDDSGGLGPTLGFFVGVGAMFTSVVLGPIINFLLSNSKYQQYTYVGYVSPPVIGLLWVLYATI